MESARTAGPRAGLELWALLAGSRLALLLTGLVATGVIGSGLAVQRGNLVYHAPKPVPLEMWARWDSEWYLLIAAEGYDTSEAFESFSVPYEREAAAGFLPLYPAAIRLFSPFLGDVAAGVLISNLCLAGSVLLLHRLVTRECSGAEGSRAGLVACAALLAFPMSLFLSAVYAESMFLLLSLAVFDRLRSDRFGLAGSLGALAALTRPGGILLTIPILMEWWSRRRESRYGWIAAAGPPAGLGVFMLMCARIFGDPLALFHRQERWRGAMSGPWRAFARWWEAGPSPHGAHDSTLEAVIALSFLLMLPALFRHLRPSYALYGAAAVMLPLCSTVWSFGRLAMTVFPFFMVVGMAWNGRWRAAVIVYLMIGGVMSGLMMALFSNWWWAG